MEFEWDEDKRLQVLAERGIDLIRAARIFRGEVLTKVDARAGYGEVREVSVGLVDEECYVVVHTLRDGIVRLVTAWKGGRRVKAEYQEGIARRNRGDAQAR